MSKQADVFMATECPIGCTKEDLNKNDGRVSRLFTTYKEQFEPVKALVRGKIPVWLDGDLVRTGPGMFEINGEKYKHLFDGMAILQRFSIKDGEVTFQSKYLRSDSFKANMEKQRIAVSEFGTLATPDPCDSCFKRFTATFTQKKATDNCCVNIIPFKNDEVYVATETPYIRKFNLPSLDTLEKVDLQQLVAVNMATAHPHFEQDGTMYNIGSSYDGKPHFCVIKVPPADLKINDESPTAFSNATILSRIPGQFRVYPCYIHSFAMTDNHIILMEQPLYINVRKVITNHQIMRRPISECFEFSKEYTTKIHVIKKSTGELLQQKYTSPPQMVFHHINAYEENGHIVMDVVDHEDGSLINVLDLDFFRKEDGGVSNGSALRFVFPLSVSEGAKAGDNLVSLTSMQTTATAMLKQDGSIYCKGEMLCGSGFDLPTVNLQYNGRKYRYFYATGVFAKGTFSNTVLKCDLQTKEVKTWKASDTAFPSEPIFVPAPDAAEEDDGVVLCGVTDVSPDVPDFLVLLDGKTLTEIGRASIPKSARIPHGFHGQFVH